MKKILFLHGLESKPGGSKVTYLRKLGYDIVNPYLPANSFTKSLEIAQKALHENPDLIVGSSRGGAIALALDAHNIPVILVAPAWAKKKTLKISEDTQYNPPKTSCILHCKTDKIINYKDSLELSDIIGSELIVCGKSHRMNDPDALHHLTDAIERLIG